MIKNIFLFYNPTKILHFNWNFCPCPHTETAAFESNNCADKWSIVVEKTENKVINLCGSFNFVFHK